MKEAVEIYRNSLSNSGNAILKDIVFRGDRNQLPEYAQKKLKELESDSFKKTKHIPDFKPKQREKGNYKESEGNFLGKIGVYHLIAAIILIPILGLVKFFEIINSIFFNKF